MKKLSILLFSMFFVYACGNSSVEDENNMLNTSIDTSTLDTVAPGDLNAQMNVAIADGFCTNETKFKLLSTSLLSAFSPAGTGKTDDPNYCGGTAQLVQVDDLNFDIHLSDYCVNFRDQQVFLNGSIDAQTESGANFVATITEFQNLSITGNGFDLTISGKTWDGRAADMFLDITITDNTTGNSIDLDETNIKKGEFDFGLFTIGEVGPYEYKFINHFNAELTEGMLFIYGIGEEKLILTAENGMVTVVYTEDRHDPGVLVESAACSS